jgi:hypothetical protein
MSALTEYLDHCNQIRELVGTRLWDLNNPEDRASLRDRVESDLSPENLTCDGELARSKVDRRYRYLMKVQKQLDFLEQHEEIHRALKES